MWACTNPHHHQLPSEDLAVVVAGQNASVPQAPVTRSALPSSNEVPPLPPLAMGCWSQDRHAYERGSWRPSGIGRAPVCLECFTASFAALPPSGAVTASRTVVTGCDELLHAVSHCQRDATSNLSTSTGRLRDRERGDSLTGVAFPGASSFGSSSGTSQGMRAQAAALSKMKHLVGNYLPPLERLARTMFVEATRVRSHPALHQAVLAILAVLLALIDATDAAVWSTNGPATLGPPRGRATDCDRVYEAVVSPSSSGSTYACARASERRQPRRENVWSPPPLRLAQFVRFLCFSASGHLPQAPRTLLHRPSPGVGTVVARLLILSDVLATPGDGDQLASALCRHALGGLCVGIIEAVAPKSLSESASGDSASVAYKSSAHASELALFVALQVAEKTAALHAGSYTKHWADFLTSRGFRFLRALADLLTVFAGEESVLANALALLQLLFSMEALRVALVAPTAGSSRAAREGGDVIASLVKVIVPGLLRTPKADVIVCTAVVLRHLLALLGPMADPRIYLENNVAHVSPQDALSEAFTPSHSHANLSSPSCDSVGSAARQNRNDDANESSRRADVVLLGGSPSQVLGNSSGFQSPVARVSREVLPLAKEPAKRKCTVDAVAPSCVGRDPVDAQGIIQVGSLGALLEWVADHVIEALRVSILCRNGVAMSLVELLSVLPPHGVDEEAAPGRCGASASNLRRVAFALLQSEPEAFELAVSSARLAHCIRQAYEAEPNEMLREVVKTASYVSLSCLVQQLCCALLPRGTRCSDPITKDQATDVSAETLTLVGECLVGSVQRACTARASRHDSSSGRVAYDLAQLPPEVFAPLVCVLSRMFTATSNIHHLALDFLMAAATSETHAQAIWVGTSDGALQEDLRLRERPSIHLLQLVLDVLERGKNAAPSECGSTGGNNSAEAYWTQLKHVVSSGALSLALATPSGPLLSEEHSEILDPAICTRPSLGLHSGSSGPRRRRDTGSSDDLQWSSLRSRLVSAVITTAGLSGQIWSISPFALCAVRSTEGLVAKAMQLGRHTEVTALLLGLATLSSPPPLPCRVAAEYVAGLLVTLLHGDESQLGLGSDFAAAAALDGRGGYPRHPWPTSRSESSSAVFPTTPAFSDYRRGESEKLALLAPIIRAFVALFTWFGQAVVNEVGFMVRDVQGQMDLDTVPHRVKDLVSDAFAWEHLVPRAAAVDSELVSTLAASPSPCLWGLVVALVVAAVSWGAAWDEVNRLASLACASAGQQSWKLDLLAATLLAVCHVGDEVALRSVRCLHLCVERNPPIVAPLMLEKYLCRVIIWQRGQCHRRPAAAATVHIVHRTARLIYESLGRDPGGDHNGGDSALWKWAMAHGRSEPACLLVLHVLLERRFGNELGHAHHAEVALLLAQAQADRATCTQECRLACWLVAMAMKRWAVLDPAFPIPQLADPLAQMGSQWSEHSSSAFASSFVGAALVYFDVATDPRHCAGLPLLLLLRMAAHLLAERRATLVCCRLVFVALEHFPWLASHPIIIAVFAIIGDWELDKEIVGTTAKLAPRGKDDHQIWIYAAILRASPRWAIAPRFVNSMTMHLARWGPSVCTPERACAAPSDHVEDFWALRILLDAFDVFAARLLSSRSANVRELTLQVRRLTDWLATARVATTPVPQPSRRDACFSEAEAGAGVYLPLGDTLLLPGVAPWVEASAAVRT